MTELRHGFTLADLNRVAASATRHAGTFAADGHDRYQTAWSAIAEHLYATDQPPSERDLWHCGRNAIWDSIRDDRRTHGAPRDGGGGEMPQFRRYWYDHATVTPSCEDRVVERLALTQIWPQLTDGNRAALAAYAAVGSMDGAAAALGVSPTALNSRLQRARNNAAALWHEHETVARNRRRDYRARTDRDHLRPCGTPTAYTRHRRRGEPVDDACRTAWTRYQAERAAIRASR
ncbi:hypothetical protein GAR05_06134 [Micromonospora saelicesensis]|uniref:Sigma-70 family RNA polymerase sigma factor n=1 Tax=Micromonospora saelicesensis TaxID=285676 RepID=A0ABX9CBJ5_9ACTN|nr:hypothetical protein [Micromonospora saelicesensis]RAN92642.1 hypothetical protein GAR05_06134 [Micromonospora saelicesensis]